MQKRRSGIILHPASLDTKYGIGDFGKSAIRFLDFLADTKQQIWQMLPLGPTGYGNSPYQCYSAFAGNPLLISPEILVDWGLLSRKQILPKTKFNPDKIEYDKVITWKTVLLREACNTLVSNTRSELWLEFEDFYTREGWWLHDYALFMTVRNLYKQTAWNKWPDALKFHEYQAIETINVQQQPEILFHKFCQFIFFKQLAGIRQEAAKREIKIIGDMPIFVAYDSADVWSRRDLFKIDSSGFPNVVAGVPPDYFSEDGQYWGNPHYDWEQMQSEDFAWWKNRFSTLLLQCDVIRIDHFRGFEAAWEVPGDAETARKGVWKTAPGEQLFNSILNEIPGLNLIAEDLGLITNEVIELRDRFNFPGMKVLQFGFFTDSADPFLPHNYEKNCIAYTGTHDNNTMSGFVKDEANPALRKLITSYLEPTEKTDLAAKAIKSILRSSANWAILPMQDLLSLGSECRINIPGTLGNHNWSWRLKRYPSAARRKELRTWTEMYGRS
jgi:4-alpha-glucanotransferase